MASQAVTNKTILLIQKWGAMLIIFLTITALNGVNSKSLYLFPIASWAVLLGGTIIRERIQNKTDEEFMEFLPNAVVTTVYFGFVINAIAFRLRSFGKSGGRKKRGGSSGSSSKSSGPGFGASYMGMAQSIGAYFSTTIYLAIFMVIINAVSHLYTFSNCGDDDNKYVKSLLNAQYNIIIISVLGAVAFMLETVK